MAKGEIAIKPKKVARIDMANNLVLEDVAVHVYRKVTILTPSYELKRADEERFFVYIHSVVEDGSPHLYEVEVKDKGNLVFPYTLNLEDIVGTELRYVMNSYIPVSFSEGEVVFAVDMRLDRKSFFALWNKGKGALATASTVVRKVDRDTLLGQTQDADPFNEQTTYLSLADRTMDPNVTAFNPAHQSTRLGGDAETDEQILEATRNQLQNIRIQGITAMPQGGGEAPVEILSQAPLDAGARAAAAADALATPITETPLGVGRGRGRGHISALMYKTAIESAPGPSRSVTFQQPLSLRRPNTDRPPSPIGQNDGNWDKEGGLKEPRGEVVRAPKKLKRPQSRPVVLFLAKHPEAAKRGRMAQVDGEDGDSDGSREDEIYEEERARTVGDTMVELHQEGEGRSILRREGLGVIQWFSPDNEQWHTHQADTGVFRDNLRRWQTSQGITETDPRETSDDVVTSAVDAEQGIINSRELTMTKNLLGLADVRIDVLKKEVLKQRQLLGEYREVCVSATSEAGRLKEALDVSRAETQSLKEISPTLPTPGLIRRPGQLRNQNLHDQTYMAANLTGKNLNLNIFPCVLHPCKQRGCNVFDRQQDLTEHIRQRHENNFLCKKVGCKMAGVQMDSHEELEEHMQNEHQVMAAYTNLGANNTVVYDTDRCSVLGSLRLGADAAQQCRGKFVRGS